MPFLAINGITFPVLDGSYQETPREIGGIGASYAGTGFRTTYSPVKNDCKFSSNAMTAAEAHAWTLLLRGCGEVFPFSTTPPAGALTGTLLGTKATGPGPVTGLSTSLAAPLYLGSTKLSIAVNTPVRFFQVKPPLFGFRWTMALWRSVGGAALDSYVVTSDGRKWLNGVRADGTVTTWLSNTGTSLRVDGDLVSVTNVDDFVYLPFEIPTAWGPSFAAIGAEYPLIPQLRLTGDILNGGSARFYIGSVRGPTPVRASGGLRYTLSVELTEV